MEINYRRNLNQSYMILHMEMFYSGYQLHMCRENKIPHLLPFETVIEDGQMKFCYEITGKRSLEHMIENREFGVEIFIQLLETLVAVSNGLKPYLLEEEGLLLLPETIFIGNADKRIYLGYCPGKHESIIESFRHLMEYILSKMNHEDETMVLSGYEAYQRVSEEGFSLRELLESMYQYRQNADMGNEETHIEEAKENITQEEAEPEQIKVKSQLHQGKMKWSVPQAGKLEKCVAAISKVPEFLTKKINHRDNPVVFEPEDYKEQIMENPTVYLTPDMTTQGVLKYDGKEAVSNILLDHFPFIIGSSEQADGKVPVHGVSRMHARITKENEDYYIEDLNSMNGTWLNEQVLVYREKERLSMHDTIQLGREKFVFM